MEYDKWIMIIAFAAAVGVPAVMIFTASVDGRKDCQEKDQSSHVKKNKK